MTLRAEWHADLLASMNAATMATTYADLSHNAYAAACYMHKGTGAETAAVIRGLADLKSKAWASAAQYDDDPRTAVLARIEAFTRALPHADPRDVGAITVANLPPLPATTSPRFDLASLSERVQWTPATLTRHEEILVTLYSWEQKIAARRAARMLAGAKKVEVADNHITTGHEHLATLTPEVAAVGSGNGAFGRATAIHDKIAAHLAQADDALAEAHALYGGDTALADVANTAYQTAQTKHAAYLETKRQAEKEESARNIATHREMHDRIHHPEKF